MKLVAGAINGQRLGELADSLTPKTKTVNVAVAYAGNDCMELFTLAEKYGAQLKFFGRYDATVAVAPAVVEWFLKRSYTGKFECRLVPDFYHPKVIWWVGHGAYIGSANLTNRAWTKNIEVGIFLNHQEMQAEGLDVQLEELFSEIERRSHAVTPQYLNHLKVLVKSNKDFDRELVELKKKFASMRFFPEGDSFVTMGKKSPAERKKERFQLERLRALEILHILGDRVASDAYRPSWMPTHAAKGVQVDQFLYVYHAQFVKGFLAAANVDASHEKNKVRCEAALQEALDWWQASEYKHDHMSRQVTETAPMVEELLAKGRLPSLSVDEFSKAFSAIHAVQQTVMNRSNEEMGLPPNQAMETKLRRHCEQLWTKLSPGGKTPLETLQYVIWGPDTENIETRIWNGSRDRKWALPWTREATLGDALGWARPHDYPPINGRSLKALRALGFDIREDAAGEG